MGGGGRGGGGGSVEGGVYKNKNTPFLGYLYVKTLYNMHSSFKVLVCESVIKTYPIILGYLFV